MTSTQAALLVTAIACGIGGVFLLVGYLRVRMTRGWTRATGVVVDRATGARPGGMPALYPTFQWQDQAGQVHQRTSSVRASLGPSPGKQVPVCSIRRSRHGRSSTATCRAGASSS